MKAEKGLFMKISEETEEAFDKVLEAMGCKSKRVLFEDMLFLYLASTRYLWRLEVGRLKEKLDRLEDQAKEYEAGLETATGDNKETLERNIAAIRQMDIPLCSSQLDDAMKLQDSLLEVGSLEASPNFFDAPYTLLRNGWAYNRQMSIFKMKDPKYRQLREANVQVAGWALPDGSEPDEDGKE